jgi:Tfp pilus assembly protein PilN
MENINLIPQEEIQYQAKGKAVKGTTVFFILLTIAALGVSGYLYYTHSEISTKAADVATQIESQRAKIKSLSATEVVVRNLDKKYNSISKLIAERPHYSRLLAELKVRQPDGVRIESMDIKDGIVNYTGDADNYILIANFINSLLNKDFPGGDPELKDLFTEVKLNSVTLDQNKSTVRFFIVVNYDTTKIKL